jgi:hypothetical protein
VPTLLTTEDPAFAALRAATPRRPPEPGSGVRRDAVALRNQARALRAQASLQRRVATAQIARAVEIRAMAAELSRQMGDAIASPPGR